MKQQIWVVVTDSVHARFFTPDKDIEGFVPAGPAELEWPKNRHSRDLKSDGPGRSFSSARNGVRHGIEPRHDAHKLEKHKFTAALADALDRAAADGAFANLVLVAPRRSLGELRGQLSSRVKSRIGEEIAKDLADAPAHLLWERLAPVVRKMILHAQMG